MRTRYFFILFSLFTAIPTSAIDLNLEIDLPDKWLFEIGDNLEYASPEYNDSKWERILVPAAWENEGFPGYDGYGWYRISFFLPKELKNKVLYLNLGQIDDVDRTYFNGRFIGGNGDFPPSYQTAYDVNRIYEIPSTFIHFGKKNTLSVRVYDGGGSGGILHGKIGLYSREDIINLNIDLSGVWKFAKGDNLDWSDPELDDTMWHKIPVPSEWERVNYPKLDGYAWYRKTVRIPRSLAKQKLILMLGKINDVDQTFFNGVQIGSTGDFPIKKDKLKSYKEKERAYFIPPYLIRPNDDNVIAVRVYDQGKTGGIYTGYIGIATRSAYLKYIRKKR